MLIPTPIFVAAFTLAGMCGLTYIAWMTRTILAHATIMAGLEVELAGTNQLALSTAASLATQTAATAAALATKVEDQAAQLAALTARNAAELAAKVEATAAALAKP
jgi:hypothetical protein